MFGHRPDENKKGRALLPGLLNYLSGLSQYHWKVITSLPFTNLTLVMLTGGVTLK